jgi:hypothetical protein
VALSLPFQAEGLHNQHQNYLDRLALVHRTSGATAREVMSLAALITTAPNPSAVIIVTGDSKPQELVDLVRQTMHSGPIVVVRVVMIGQPTLSSVRGALVLTTPAADQLAGVWAEAVERL